MRSFPIVLLLLISYLSKETEQTSFRPAHDKVSPEFGENRHHNEISSHHTIHNNLEPAFRMKRAGSDITTIHSKLTLAARVFSGIATRVGIHDGSITGDQFISEMLNFDDSINLDDVENFDKAKVDQFFQDLKGLSIPPTIINLKKFENKVEVMTSLREKYETISNPKDKTAIDEFVGKVETFPDLNVKLKDLKMMGNTMTSALSVLSTINEYGATSVDQPKLESLKTDLSVLTKLSTKVETALQTLNNHKDLIGRKILDSPMLQNVELLARFDNGSATLALIPDSSAEFESALITISTISSDFDKVFPYLNVIQQIGSLQSVSKIPTGFINGFSDVIKLSSDVEDSWLPKIINKYDNELIKSELKPLDKFKTSYVAVESQWKQLSNEDVIPIIRTIASTFNESTATHNKTAIGEICDKALPAAGGFSSGLMGFVDKMLKFRETLLMLIAKLTTISKLDKLKTLESQVNFKDKIDFTNSRTLKQVQDDMPKNGELGTLIQDINTLKPFFEEFKKIIDDLTKLAGDIKNEKNAVDTFLADTSTIAFFKYCEYLKEMKTDLESLSKAVTLTRTVRVVQNHPNFSATLPGVTQKISGPIQDFKTLRAVPDAIKSAKTPRIKELIQLKQIQNSSRILGEAVAVLDTAHSIISTKTEIRDLIEKGWDVSGVISNESDVEKKGQYQRDWRQFSDLAMYFESLISTLETSMSSVSRIRRGGVSELEEYASRLSSLKNLPDFKIDLLPMMTVLDKLPTLQSRDQMLSTMRNIQNLDLQFSAHSSALTSVGSSATTTVNLFGNVQKPAAAISSSTPGAGDPRIAPSSKNGSGNLKAAGGNVVKESDDNDGTVVVVVGFGFVALVAVIAVLVWFCWRRLNKKVPPPTPDVDLEAGTHPKPDSTTTASSAAQSPAPPAAPAPEKPKDAKNEKEKKVPEEPKEAKAENKPTEHVPDPSEKPAERGDSTTTEDTKSRAPPTSGNTTATHRSKSRGRRMPLERVREIRQQLTAEFLKQFDKEAERKRLYGELKNAEPQQKESLEKQYREVTDQLHAIYKSIEQLSKLVNRGVVIEAKKDASTEYEKTVKMIDEMPGRIDANRAFDEPWVVVRAKRDFNNIPLNVLDEIAKTRNAWILSEEDFDYTTKRSIDEIRLRFIESRLLNYTPNGQAMLEWFQQHKGLPRQMTVALAPYMLRLEWVNKTILNEMYEDVLKFDEHKKRDPKVDPYVNKLYFDHSRYRLRNNRTLNIAVFNMPYGEQIFLCNAPQTEEEKDELLQMMVEGRVGFAYSFADEWDEWKDTTNCKVWVDAKADLCVEEDILSAHLPMGSTEITGTVKKFNVLNRATKEKTQVIRFTSSEWTRDAVPLEYGFRKRIFQILIHITRHRNKRVLLIDDKIGSRSSAFLLAEYISSQISTYGTLAADLTTHLLALAKHRSRLFVDPDLVMFGAYLAVNRVYYDHDIARPHSMRHRLADFEYRWRDFENCRNKKKDDERKRDLYPDHAKLMEIDMNELPSVEEAKTQEETLTSTAKE